MKRLKLIVYGKVQRVGYRDAVAELARRLGIKGTVQNMDDDVSVEIIAEGDDKQLQEFVKLVDIRDYAIAVEKLDVKEEKATGKFKQFKILRGEGFAELGDRLDAAGSLLYKSLEKQDQMMSKQDATIAAIKGVDHKQDTMIQKQDQMLNKQDETVNVLKETNQKLDTVEVKYGKVSESLGKLESIDTHLKELVDILRTFKPQ